MRISVGSDFLGTVLIAMCAIGATHSLFGSTPEFSVAATNVTMPSKGDGISDITLTSLNGYSGQVALRCVFSGDRSLVDKVPSCDGGPVFAISLHANQSAKGELSFYPPGVAVPASRSRTRQGATRPLLAGLALASLGLLGLRPRRRAWRRFAVVALSLAGISTFVACGGSSSNSMPPGSYSYTINAIDIQNNSTVSTNILVNIP
jgi:hypothetical protein